MCLIITFHTTTEAMAFESLIRARQLPGRLIPVPTSIRAGCGLAWMAPAESSGQIISLIDQSGIGYDTIYNHDL